MIKIYTFQFNDADFLEYQYKTFKKFLKEEHQLVCINNATDENKKETIQKKAVELGVPHYFPKNVNHSLAGYSHQTAIQWTWDNFIVNSDDISIILDHDIFLIKEFSPDLSYDITGIMQGRGEHIRYFHPGFMVINNTLKDKETVSFKGEVIDGHTCDSGGNTYRYIQNHPNLKIRYLNLVNICAEHENLNIIPEQFRDGYELTKPFQILDNFAIHCLDGSNWSWADKDLMIKKKQRLYNVLDYYLSI